MHEGARRRMSTDVTIGSLEIKDASAGARTLAGKVEALLLSVDRPVHTLRLAEALGLIAPEEPTTDEGATQRRIDEAERKSACGSVEEAIALLNEEYARGGRSFRVEQLAGGWRVTTLPQFAEVIAEFHRQRLAVKLSRQAVETLAIIAYKQPITRAELEAIRGVSCGEVLKSL